MPSEAVVGVSVSVLRLCVAARSRLVPVSFGSDAAGAAAGLLREEGTAGKPSNLKDSRSLRAEERMTSEPPQLECRGKSEPHQVEDCLEDVSGESGCRIHFGLIIAAERDLPEMRQVPYAARPSVEFCVGGDFFDLGP